MVKVMIGAIWRTCSQISCWLLNFPHDCTASFYRLKNTFGPNAGMRTNEFGEWVCHHQPAQQVTASFSIFHTILGNLTASVSAET